MSRFFRCGMEYSHGKLQILSGSNAKQILNHRAAALRRLHGKQGRYMDKQNRCILFGDNIHQQRLIRNTRIGFRKHIFLFADSQNASRAEEVNRLNLYRSLHYQ